MDKFCGVFVLLVCLLSMGSAELKAQSSGSPFAGKTLADLNGDDVLRLVRYSYTKVNRSFKGQLRHDKKKIPFLLTLKPDSIMFQFSSPYQMIELTTKNDQLVLKESFGAEGKLKVVKSEWYRQRIRGTDVTFDDISMRFLYWPKAKILKEEKLLRRDAWLVQVMNPSGLGDYGSAWVWVDKGSGSMLRMEGFEPKKGKKIKTFRVQSVKKMGDIWMVDQMLIETLNPATGKRVSRTYLDILEEVK
ncbi:MAG: outer membrane lipoprotein-sorting protein [Verrucomicrobiota bacterium]